MSTRPQIERLINYYFALIELDKGEWKKYPKPLQDLNAQIITSLRELIDKLLEYEAIKW